MLWKRCFLIKWPQLPLEITRLRLRLLQFCFHWTAANIVKHSCPNRSEISKRSCASVYGKRLICLRRINYAIPLLERTSLKFIDTVLCTLSLLLTHIFLDACLRHTFWNDFSLYEGIQYPIKRQPFSIRLSKCKEPPSTQCRFTETQHRMVTFRIFIGSSQQYLNFVCYSGHSYTFMR